MARPFPTFGHDLNGRGCLFIGEAHDNNENLNQLCWQMMWLEGRINGVFIEYYQRLTGPTQGQIQQELIQARFAAYRPHMHMEVADLRHQCVRRGIGIEGWNRANANPLQRASQSWNDFTALMIAARAQTLGWANYVVFGGSVHGHLFAQAPALAGMPCFVVHGGAFRQYDRSDSAGVHWSA